MSAQGTTLRRGTAPLPMWPLAVLVAGAAAIVLVISLLDARPATPVGQPVTLVERFANSGAIPAASTDEAGATTTFASLTLVERFANSGAIPAATTDQAGGATTFAPVTLVERSANSGVIPGASTDEGGVISNPCPEACQVARRG
jgi:hypothetical protein